MPQIVKPHAIESGGLCHGAPRLLEVRAGRAVPPPSDNMRIVFDARERRQDGLRGGGKINRLLSGFGVRQKNDAALQLNLIANNLIRIPKLITA
jgi:hypothetical protein